MTLSPPSITPESKSASLPVVVAPFIIESGFFGHGDGSWGRDEFKKGSVKWDKAKSRLKRKFILLYD